MVEHKIVLPERNAECEAYREIDSHLLEQLREIEAMNNMKLSVFWRLNGCKDGDGNK